MSFDQKIPNIIEENQLKIYKTRIYHLVHLRIYKERFFEVKSILNYSIIADINPITGDSPYNLGPKFLFAVESVRYIECKQKKSIFSTHFIES